DRSRPSAPGKARRRQRGGAPAVRRGDSRPASGGFPRVDRNTPAGRRSDHRRRREADGSSSRAFRVPGGELIGRRIQPRCGWGKVKRVLPGRLARLLKRHPAVWLFRNEIRVWADLIRLMRRKRVVAPGQVPIPAETGLWGIPGMMTVATIIEIIALELLLPWPAVRVVFALVSIYSLVILWGLIGQRAVHPHTGGPERVVKRGRTIVAKIE